MINSDKYFDWCEELELYPDHVDRCDFDKFYGCADAQVAWLVKCMDWIKLNNNDFVRLNNRYPRLDHDFKVREILRRSESV